ncbi:hypothetical protein RR48_08593 [Papilio machaon]|uniref:Uncharacterized protein n=1 Tax=Papilio machaon TaxID=76193 RepID=A0A194RIM1_PAPMA|nr:hypothetical protein RR48_08593 [Papilio machaon]
MNNVKKKNVIKLWDFFFRGRTSANRFWPLLRFEKETFHHHCSAAHSHHHMRYRHLLFVKSSETGAYPE